jgi:hypothetical protein
MGRAAYESFTCTCGVRCVMVPHQTTGKLAPITIATYPDGNVVVNLASVNGGHGTYRIAGTEERARDPHRPRSLNHFASCPNASDFGGRTR